MGIAYWNNRRCRGFGTPRSDRGDKIGRPKNYQLGHFEFAKVQPQTLEVCIEIEGFQSRCLPPVTIKKGKQESVGFVELKVAGGGGISIAKARE